jgi:hypothetical protein
MQIVNAVQAPSGPIAVGGTAGALKDEFGDWFDQLGAVDGGEPLGAKLLRLRFDSATDAADARAALRDSIDGVRIVVTDGNGSTPQADADPGAVAALLEHVRGVNDIATTGAFTITSADPDTNAHLAVLLRPRICNLPVAFRTGAPDGSGA